MVAANVAAAQTLVMEGHWLGKLGSGYNGLG